MKRLAVLLTAVLLLLTACGDNRFNSKLYDFTAVCPEGWTVSEDMASASFMAPVAGDTDDFYENVNYAGAIPLVESGAGTLDGFVELVVEGVSGNTGAYTEISRENETIAGLDAIVLTYTCTTSQSSYVIKQRMFIMTDGENVYNIVYTANEGSFDTYADAARSIAESFQAK